MTDNASFTDLGLTDVSVKATDSDAGCSCCALPGAEAASAELAAGAASIAESATSSDWQVAGMTCGHCVSAVTTELSALEGVTAVDVALVAGGVSTVTVQSAQPLDAASVAAAIDEAGYSLAS